MDLSMAPTNLPKVLNQTLCLTPEVIKTSSAEALLEVIKFIENDQEQLNSPRIDYIEILFSIASK